MWWHIIPNRTSIHERPAEAIGKRFGDWEMDLIVDSRQRVILTLVERSTNFLMEKKLRFLIMNTNTIHFYNVTKSCLSIEPVLELMRKEMICRM